MIADEVWIAGLVVALVAVLVVALVKGVSLADAEMRLKYAENDRKLEKDWRKDLEKDIKKLGEQHVAAMTQKDAEILACHERRTQRVDSLLRERHQLDIEHVADLERCERDIAELRESLIVALLFGTGKAEQEFSSEQLKLATGHRVFRHRDGMSGAVKLTVGPGTATANSGKFL